MRCNVPTISQAVMRFSLFWMDPSRSVLEKARKSNAQQSSKRLGIIIFQNYFKTYSEIIRPIFPISTFPLNSNFAVNVFENIMNNSESGNNSANPGV